MFNYNLCVEELLKCEGVNVNGKDSLGDEPLHLALAHKQIRLVLSTLCFIMLLVKQSKWFIRVVAGLLF